LKNACAKKPCQNNATCQAGFTDRDYQCLCIPGFTGHDCEQGTTHILLLLAVLLNLAMRILRGLNTKNENLKQGVVTIKVGFLLLSIAFIIVVVAINTAAVVGSCF